MFVIYILNKIIDKFRVAILKALNQKYPSVVREGYFHGFPTNLKRSRLFILFRGFSEQRIDSQRFWAISKFFWSPYFYNIRNTGLRAGTPISCTQIWKITTGIDSAGRKLPKILYCPFQDSNLQKSNFFQNWRNFFILKVFHYNFF